MKYNIYQCLKCKEKNTIYPSYWPPIHKKGILSCYKCGENEESKNGISKNGVRIGIVYKENPDKKEEYKKRFINEKERKNKEKPNEIFI